MLITQAGRGIGRAKALTFVKAGAKEVALAARSTHELAGVEAAVQKAAPGTNLVTVATDVMDEGSMNRLFRERRGSQRCVVHQGILLQLTNQLTLCVLVLFNNIIYMELQKCIQGACPLRLVACQRRQPQGHFSRHPRDPSLRSCLSKASHKPNEH
jgi:NAD(P)-dependent dehydrogenase (short-subunit alcohol dehydrogenase family)